MSFVYDELNMVEAIECGYFEPAEKWNPLSGICFKHSFGSGRIKTSTKIYYYPGSFGSFHQGHLSVVEAVIKLARENYGEDFVVVVAPANSEYLIKKYGKNSLRSTNKFRYNQIMKTLKENLCEDDLKHLIIDLSPMLNYRCDQNFTDLLRDFCQEHVSVRGIRYMKAVPCLVFGKDCKGVSLSKYTRLLETLHIDDTTGFSTSGLPNPQFKKKHLYLRCRTLEEFNLFVEFYGDEYLSVKSIDINKEIVKAKEFIANAKDTVFTICKDYQGIAKYVKMSRVYDHPLAEPYHERFPKPINDETNCVVLDSDIFTGGTAEVFRGRGIKFHAIIDIQKLDKDEYELLDIDDFKSQSFRYPFVDISSKCSMRAFDFEDHLKLELFNKRLRQIASLEWLRSIGETK